MRMMRMQINVVMPAALVKEFDIGALDRGSIRAGWVGFYFAGVADGGCDSLGKFQNR